MFDPDQSAYPQHLFRRGLCPVGIGVSVMTFINTLMRDIGHNIIVPNMQFKLLFSRMEERLRDMEDKVNALYYKRAGESAINLTVMQEIDRAFTEWPFLGVHLQRRFHFR